MGLTQRLPAHGRKYISLVVHMTSHCTGAFPCGQAVATSVANVLLEEAIKPGGLPTKSTVRGKCI